VDGEADPARIAMSNKIITIYHLYQGPLGQVVRQGTSFLASKDGIPVGEYSTLEQAMVTLEWK